MNQKNIQYLLDHGFFSALDIHFAGLMTRFSGKEDEDVFLAAALVSRATGEGHVCLDISTVDGRPLIPNESGTENIVTPKVKVWRNKLDSSSIVGRPGDYRPLILDDRSRLYLYRYWDYEDILAKKISERLGLTIEGIDLSLLKEDLSKFFSPLKNGQTDWQKLAVFVSVLKRFCVISGGPGTGKSTLIARIIALILKQRKGSEMRIAIAAPTGKSAARLQEAIQNGKETLSVEETVKKSMPTEASTIHRLLRTIPGSPYFRYNAENLLPVDMVIIDEASMVDLALMSKLVQALPLDARLVLVGDKDQLASVEAGAVLGDICDTGRIHRFSKGFLNRFQEITGHPADMSQGNGSGLAIKDSVVELKKNYRFGPESGIRAVSLAVNQGDGRLALRIFKSGEYDDIKWETLPESNALYSLLRENILHGFKPFLETKDPFEAHRLFEKFRILGALRKGPYGVSAQNVLVEQILREENLIDTSKRWYRGRPVMITKNDYTLGLFNGDIGIILPDPAIDYSLRAFFLSPGGALRSFLPPRLPAHETVYATTVHKSQGSEFEKALLILPDQHTPVLTRELIYTGITRAKKSIEVWGTERIFIEGVSQRIERSSGLRDALWKV